jgi:hypothetical protein
LASSEAYRLGRAFVEAWASGALETELLPGASAAGLRELRHTLAAAVAALQASGVDLGIETRDLNPDETTARRWCWVEPWILMSQDEDLLLMDEHLIVPLLDEAAANCPKRDYVLSVVEHGIRDGAHHQLRHGPDALAAYFAKAADWVVHARAARAADLTAYCERLASYASPGPVDAEGARVRGSDLTRCHPDPDVHVDRKGNAWVARVSSSGATALLSIDVSTGVMWMGPAAGRR